MGEARKVAGDASAENSDWWSVEAAVPPNSCPQCQLPILSINAVCQTCGQHLGAINVLLASNPREQDELRRRVTEAVSAARSDGSFGALSDLAVAVRDQSSAVVNVTPDFALTFLSHQKSLYASYARQLVSSRRAKAAIDDDRARVAVESMLFGSSAGEVVYGALSLDGRGLRTYGPVSLVLDDASIRTRASVLETNSYAFTEGIGPTSELPLGRRAPWGMRHLVAASKLASRLTSDTKSNAFPALLLSPADHRREDEFIEVHIAGSFDSRAVKEVWIPAADSVTLTSLYRQLLRELTAKIGIRLGEY